MLFQLRANNIRAGKRMIPNLSNDGFKDCVFRAYGHKSRGAVAPSVDVGRTQRPRNVDELTVRVVYVCRSPIWSIVHAFGRHAKPERMARTIVNVSPSMEEEEAVKSRDVGYVRCATTSDRRES